MDYIQEKVDNWDKVRSEEQTLSFLLLYRTIETIFRRILPKISAEPITEEINFIKLIDILKDNNMLTSEEVTLLHEIRFKRNVLFHEPGKKLTLGKSMIEKVLSLIQEVLSRSEEK